jgi:ParB/RepB/Spo0J family partition protein
MGLDIKDIPLDSLYISPRNVRTDSGDLTELMASIKDIGVLEPILVRQKGEEYEVIAGRRRLEAARSIGLPTIPASVLDVTDLQAIIISLIENIQRKELTLAERVQTYQTLQQLAPDYRSQRSFAKAIGVSHRKIGEDFQAYEMALKLQPHGIRVESHFPRTSPERQRGDVLPEYHAVMLQQASASRRAKAAVPNDVFDADLAKLAREIAPHSQDEAKEILAVMQSAVDYMDKLLPQETPSCLSTSRGTQAVATQGEEAGSITCSWCNRVLQLIHADDGTHSVMDTPFTGQTALPAPVFPLEPVPVALNPDPAIAGCQTTSDTAPALEDFGTPQPILKRTSGYTITSFPKGLNTILTPQTSGFWGKLTDSLANPDFTETDMPQSIWTVDPWIGCLWGLS